MADKNSQRIFSLVLCLSETKVPLLREQIREKVEWYHGLSDQNFLATFERDKALIRDWGIGIEVPGEGAESRYQILKDSHTLPPLDFTDEEANLIAAAAKIWDHTKLTGESDLALAKLRAAKVGLGEAPTQIQASLPGKSPKVDVLLEALTSRKAVKFKHGDSPERVVEPWYLHFYTGQWYLFGWDRSKGESRTFLVSKMASVPTIIQSAQPIDPPREDCSVLVERVFPITGDKVAKVAIRSGKVSDLRRKGTPISGEVPDGFELWEVPYASDEYHEGRFAQAIVGEGADAIVFEPEELRSRVIELLKGVLENGQR